MSNELTAQDVIDALRIYCAIEDNEFKRGQIVAGLLNEAPETDETHSTQTLLDLIGRYRP